MIDDIAALIEETEHMLAILEQKATEEMGGYDYVRPKIRKAKDALSHLTTPRLSDEIAALIAETERALQEVPQDILRRNLASLRALAQENEGLRSLAKCDGCGKSFDENGGICEPCHSAAINAHIKPLVELRINAERERDAIRAKTIKECATIADNLDIHGCCADGCASHTFGPAIHALAQTDETKSNVAAIANSHI